MEQGSTFLDLAHMVFWSIGPDGLLSFLGWPFSGVEDDLGEYLLYPKWANDEIDSNVSPRI